MTSTNATAAPSTSAPNARSGRRIKATLHGAKASSHTAVQAMKQQLWPRDQPRSVPPLHRAQKGAPHVAPPLPLPPDQSVISEPSGAQKSSLAGLCAALTDDCQWRARPKWSWRGRTRRAPCRLTTRRATPGLAPAGSPRRHPRCLRTYRMPRGSTGRTAHRRCLRTSPPARVSCVPRPH
jgi:hypothetical protein